MILGSTPQKLKTFLSLIFLISLSFNVSGQVTTGIWFKNDTISPQRYIANYGINAYQHSGAFPVGMTIALLRGGTINSTEINKGLKSLKESNGWMGNFTNLVELKTLSKKVDELEIYYAVGNRTLSHGTFSKDLFRLVFEGNVAFQDTTANLSPLKFNFVNYNFVKAGGILNLGEGVKLGMSLGLLQGNTFFHLSSDKGSLYTAKDGTEISFDARLKVERNIGSSILSGRGFGTTTDYFMSFKATNWDFRIDLNDIGFISYNESTEIIDLDTNQTFNGVDVSNVLFNGGQIGGSDIDSLSEILSYTRGKGKVRYNLPFSIRFSAERFLKDYNTTFRGQLVYYNLTDYNPLVLGELSKPLTKYQVHTSIYLGFGGFGGIQSGFSFAKKLKSGWEFKVGSNSHLGLILPSSVTNGSIFGSLSYRFGSILPKAE